VSRGEAEYEHDSPGTGNCSIENSAISGGVSVGVPTDLGGVSPDCAWETLAGFLRRFLGALGGAPSQAIMGSAWRASCGTDREQHLPPAATMPAPGLALEASTERMSLSQTRAANRAVGLERGRHAHFGSAADRPARPFTGGRAIKAGFAK
jgi:hypothetical protein